MEISNNLKQLLEQKQTKITIVAIAIVITIIIGFGLVDAVLYANKVHMGVAVGGLSVAGKDKAEVIAELHKLANIFENKPIVIKHEKKSWTTSAKKLNTHLDAEDTFKKAFLIGRKGGLGKIIGERISILYRAKDVKPVFKHEKSSLDNYVKSISRVVNRPAEDAMIKIVDDKPAITNSKSGYEVDGKTLINKIIIAFSSKKASNIELPINVVTPDIKEDDLSQVKEVAKNILKAPITLEYKDRNWSIEGTQISQWIEFKKIRSGSNWELDIDFDKDEMTGYLDKLTKDISIEPKDAQFSIKDDKVVVVPGSVGQKVDLEKAYDNIIDASKKIDSRVVMLTTKPVEPNLTTEDASKMGIKEKVASYTTFFNPRQTSRVHNIQLLSSELDGNIIAPGEVFSFNGTIGPRTAKKGYREAPAIIRGELVPSLGGGVCQVATTLFNTVFFGGYKVVERHNHSFFISHYPTGRDATVSYGGPDLKFKNNTKHHFLIKTKCTASSLAISFYSTKQNLTVRQTTKGPTNFKPAKTEYKDDPTLEKGVTKVFDKGISGRDVTVFRTVIVDGKTLFSDKFFSRYSPKKSIVNVGTIETTQDATVNNETPPTNSDVKPVEQAVDSGVNDEVVPPPAPQ